MANGIAQREELTAMTKITVPASVMAKPTDPNWCRDFDRFAKELAKTPVPWTFGASVKARQTGDGK